jgi:hypothetical protein
MMPELAMALIVRHSIATCTVTVTRGHGVTRHCEPDSRATLIPHWGPTDYGRLRVLPKSARGGYIIG